MTLHAQASALRLYRQAGYASEGTPFDEEGIEHLGMALTICQAEPPCAAR